MQTQAKEIPRDVKNNEVYIQTEPHKRELKDQAT